MNNDSRLLSLNNCIIEWGRSKGIMEKSDPFAQLSKSLEELGELAEAINKEDMSNIHLEIGDLWVTLVLLAALNYEIPPYERDSYLYEEEGDDFYDSKSALARVAFELGHIAGSIYRGFKVVEWGDITFAMDKLCEAYNLVLEDCIEAAYWKISKRTGTMQNGVFVKDGGYL